jgi:toxin ParE1/3/4
MTALFEILVTEAAEQDLVEIFEDLRVRASAKVAEDLLDGLLECVATLETLPERGSTPDALAGLGIRDFRQFVLRTWRVIYRVIGPSVFILVIADGRQDMQRLLERRLLEH